MFKIEIINNLKNSEINFDLKQAESTTKKIFKALKCNGNQLVEVLFVDNQTIKKLNLKYRNNDSVTDVLSFPINLKSDISENIFGSIVIAPEFAQKEGIRCNQLFEHGLLHLCGFDHEKDIKKWNLFEKAVGTQTIN